MKLRQLTTEQINKLIDGAKLEIVNTTDTENVAHCVFNSCDSDSKGKEGHLYISKETGQYQCKKCNESGNLYTLYKHQGLNTNEFFEQSKTKDKTVERHHINLPGDIKKYLNNRGITENLINSYQLGYASYYKQNWITIPIKNNKGTHSFFKLRQCPFTNKGDIKYIAYPKGSSAELFPSLDISKDYVVIVEGEFDSIVLNSKGINTVSSTAGAGTFKDIWVEKLAGFKSIYICFDNDKAGSEGAKKLAERLLEKLLETKVYITSLPENFEEHEDITDYLVKYKLEANDLLTKYSKEFTKINSRIVEVPDKYVSITLEEWESTIKNNFAELLIPARLSLYITVQFLIKDISNPFGLIIVGMPSAGKTITLNFFSNIEGISYTSDKFTPASFVSSAANIKKDELSNIDLLPRIKNKVFIVRDLATLFSKREDDLNESLGILTRVFDGEGLSVDSGTHGQREYRGEFLFMFLAATTPIKRRVWDMMGNLGARLFFYNLEDKNVTATELLENLTKGNYKDKELECRNQTKNLIYTLWDKYKGGVDWDATKDDKATLLAIGKYAKLLADLRGVVNIWYEKDEEGNNYRSHDKPVKEAPHRLNQLFYNIMRSHALVQGRKYVTKDDLWVVRELALNSADSHRICILKLLITNDVVTTEMVEKGLRVSKPTALKEIHILLILGVASKVPVKDYMGPIFDIRLSKKYKWLKTNKQI